ncbi:MAG: hypothetical protein ACYTEQ_13335 [Planctomycetota bacterium]|jgi:tetratricopeptide (TPR) repeat protein
MHRKTRKRSVHACTIKNSFVPCFFALALLGCGAVCRAQAPSDSEQLFSPSVANEFYEAARELADSESAGAAEIEQAVTFLAAAMRLDSRAKHILPDMIKVVSRHPEHDYSRLMGELFVSYVDEFADLEVAGQALSYLLDRSDSHEEREQLLAQILESVRKKNDALASEVATRLGLLKAERADAKAAQSYFLYAYKANRHNKVAFAKLAELSGEQIQPAIYFERLRLALGENPLDIQRALALAQYAERLQLYETASDSYEYCTQLFRFLYPSRPLPPSIYLPWAISSYNTQRNQRRCLQIASELRQSGRFDLLLEAVAGKAAAKMGNQQQAERILKAAAEKARRILLGIDKAELYKRGSKPQPRTTDKLSPQQLAWFHCFVLPDANDALDWANKAYSSEPNSPAAAAILAYALVMSGQTDWAKLLTDNYERNQIAELALGQIYLAKGQSSSAMETLKAAIARDPASLAAERAREILAAAGGQYIPAVDPDVVLQTLEGRFGGTIVPVFARPAEIISVELKLRGSKFSYGSDFDAAVAITNNGADPLLISEGSLFEGRLRVDVEITGDLDERIPNLLSVRLRPSSPVKPGESIFIPLHLVAGRLRKILITHPQASLDVQFTAFVDPVIDAGEVKSGIGIMPVRAVAKRPGVELGNRYLQNRLDALSKGRQGPKIKTAQLFAGLLMEQQAMAGREPLYRFAYADWMPDVLKSALVHNLADEAWTVKVHTMAAITSLPLDYELTSAAAKCLNDTHWPCRLMATHLLAKSENRNFSKVLDWTAKYDPNENVRRMAIALGGRQPEQSTPLDLVPLQPDSL